VRLSVQCYTLRELFAQDVWGTFRALRDLGFDFVELAGYYDLPPKELRAGLDLLGLQVSGSHLGLDRLEGDLEQVIEENYTLDNRYIILPWISKDDYAQGWTAFAKRVEPIAARIREAGLWFAYHNHSFEFEKDGGRPGLEVFFEASDPDTVLAQVDVAWVQHGGHDPAEMIRRLGPRSPLVHLKDLSGEPGPQDAVAGDGVVNWDVVLDACTEAQVEFGTIEMDEPPGDPLEDTRRCLAFFQAQGFR
jgi:sugar phosphate isomerase/epimerase